MHGQWILEALEHIQSSLVFNKDFEGVYRPSQVRNKRERKAAEKENDKQTSNSSRLFQDHETSYTMDV